MNSEHSNLPNSLIDLREQLTVWLLVARADLNDLGRQSKYTRAEAARLAECSAQTIRDAISAGKLETGSSGWIARPHLTEWLGYDPIQHRIEEIVRLERSLALIDSELSTKTSENIQNLSNLSDSVSNNEPAA